MKLVFSSAFVLAGSLFFSSATFAAESCPQYFAYGDTPVVTNPVMAKDTTQLCFHGYALLFSPISRTALWSAETLTPQIVAGSHGLPRINSFHAEPRLPHGVRAELSDYRGSCFDRGHLVPNGDAPNAVDQADTFSLANMIPQNPENNQGLWAGLESSTRTLVSKIGPMNIITGPIFEGATLQRLNQRILVPTYVYKAIYDVNNGRAAAYVAPNAPGDQYEVVSIAQLEKRIGINLFPRMPEAIKTNAMKLPRPAKSHHAREPRAGCEAGAQVGQAGQPPINVEKTAEKAAIAGLKYFMKH